MAMIERLLREPLQQRQREAGGLAGAGLCRAEKIAAGEDDGDGLRLDGGGLGVALLGDRLEQLGREAEIFERCVYETLLVLIQERDLSSDSWNRPGKDWPSHRFRRMSCVEGFGDFGQYREGAVTLTG
jgi:hypothetical protein